MITTQKFAILLLFFNISVKYLPRLMKEQSTNMCIVSKQQKDEFFMVIYMIDSHL